MCVLQLTGNSGELLSNSPKIHPTALQKEKQLKSMFMATNIMIVNIETYFVAKFVK